MEFSAGDMVYLKMKPYHRKSLAHRNNEKLAPRYYRPFKVLAKVGKVAYRLNHQEYKFIRYSMSHNWARPVGEHHLPSQLPSNLGADWELLVEPEAMMGVRTTSRGTSTSLDVFIQWKGLSPLEATWEPFSLITNRFPAFHLEGKLAKLGGIIDKPPVKYTYTRRNKKNGERRDSNIYCVREGKVR